MAKLCWKCNTELEAIPFDEKVGFVIHYYQMYKCGNCGRVFQALDEPIKVK